ncbi:MAG: zinc-binding dehydrogenase [Oscillospiraceae bacterium]|nr:zinc-binding dehydrogenase [Oscillospiraceae bacterium]
MRCKAALLPKMGPYQNIVVEEVEVAEPSEYEVQLKVMTCTICHSDIHALTGEHGAYEGPGMAGHEIAGVVTKIGPKVTYVKPGDRVICSEVRAGCGQCEPCLKGHQWFCQDHAMTTELFRIPGCHTRLNGERCIQTCSGTSGFAEYCNAHESMLCKLDSDIPFEVGSALACGFMSGFGAVLNRCQVRPGESFAVCGCGGVGLSAIMGAKYSGACPIIAIDTMPEKLEAAKKFGATHTLNPKECDVIAEVKKITRGLGVEHTFTAVAGKGIKKQMWDMTAGWGQMVIVGHGHHDDEWCGDINYFDFLRGRKITGCVMGGVTPRRDIPKYMEMYRAGQIDIDALLTNRFTLDQIREALEDSCRGALKDVVYIGCDIPEDLAHRP